MLEFLIGVKYLINKILVKVFHITIEFFYIELKQLRLDPRVSTGKTTT
jgi:hypothetical protein